MVLGPSMILAGTPFALIYAVRCWRRAPHAALSIAAMAIAVLEALGVACMALLATIA